MEDPASASSSLQTFSPGNKIFIVKLTYDNFLLWKFQILIALEGYELEKHHEDDPPSETLQSTVEGTSMDEIVQQFVSDLAYMQ